MVQRAEGTYTVIPDLHPQLAHSGHVGELSTPHYSRVIPNQIWVAQAPRWFSSRKRPAPAVPRRHASRNARRKKMQEWSSPRVPIGRIGSQNGSI